MPFIYFEYERENELSYAIPTIEKELVEKCLEQNQVAQRELFLKYKDAMYTILLRMLNNQDEATDALQETFISVFQGLTSFRFQSTLGAWIKTITVRTGIARQKKKKVLSLVPLEEIEQEPISWPDEITGEALELAISRLSAGYRTIFLLIEVEGYSHKEVAEMLEINEGTSKSQLYHAKRSLRKVLKEYRY